LYFERKKYIIGENRHLVEQTATLVEIFLKRYTGFHTFAPTNHNGYGKENKQFSKKFSFLEQETVLFDIGRHLFDDACRNFRIRIGTGVAIFADVGRSDLLHNGDDTQSAYPQTVSESER
jgi:hypothetical protein